MAADDALIQAMRERCGRLCIRGLCFIYPWTTFQSCAV